MAVALVIVVAAAVAYYRAARTHPAPAGRVMSELRTGAERAAPDIPSPAAPGGGVVGEREPLSRPAIRLQVLNGCGVKGLASQLAVALRGKGFDVRETGNARRGDYVRSEVVDRVGNTALAFAVADSLGIHVSRVSSDTSGDLADIDVTLVVGRDYRQLNLHLDGLSKE